MIDMKMIAADDAATPGAGRAIVFVGADGRIRSKLAGGQVIDPLAGERGSDGLKGEQGLPGAQGLPGQNGADGVSASQRIWPASQTQLGAAVAGLASPGRLIVGAQETEVSAGMVFAGTVVVDVTGTGNIQLRLLAGGLVFLFTQIPLSAARRVYFEFEAVLLEGGAAFAICGQAAQLATTAIALPKIAASSITGVLDGSPFIEARLISAGLTITPRMANIELKV